MAMLENAIFAQMKFGEKVLKGNAMEALFKGWMECNSSMAVLSQASDDGVYFGPNFMRLVVTKETSEIYQEYFARGYKKLIITLVHRGTDTKAKDYEMQRVVFDDCVFDSLDFEANEGILFMNFQFRVKGTVELTINVPNEKNDGLDKIGPIKYSIPEKKLI